MRDDLDKVLTESPRSGGGGKFPRQIKYKGDLENLDQVSIKTGIRKPYGINSDPGNRNTKMFTDQLSPLYGLIRKNIGKNWDKLFSELRKKFKPDSRTHQHIYEHLFQFIEVKTRLHEGVVQYNERRLFSGDTNAWKPIDSHVEFYVHPKTHCIIKNKRYQNWKQRRNQNEKERLAKEAKFKKVISKDLEACLINDIWYLFEFDLTPPMEYTEQKEIRDGKVVTVVTEYSPIKSCLFASAMNIAHMDKHYSTLERGYEYMDSTKQTTVQKSFRTGDKTEIRQRYAKSKKQLNHQELKKYDLI